MSKMHIQQKGERRISAALRIMLVVVLVLAQILFVVLLSRFLEQYMALAYGALQICSLLLAIYIYNTPEDLSYKLSWFILILTVPVVGLILWFLWGGAAQKRHLPQQAQRLPQEPESVLLRSEMNADKRTRQRPG